MSLPFSLKRSGGWVMPVTILSIVLGMLIAASLKTQQNIKKSGFPSPRYDGLAQAYMDEKAKNAVLEKRLADERSKVITLQESEGSGSTKERMLREDKHKADLLAGLLPVEGQGVEITLEDYPGRIPDDVDALLRDQYIIHDVDLRDTINELYANGAEAVSVKSEDTEQRLIASSSIRCVGGTIQINKVDMSSPFVIKAVGPPSAMYKGLTMNGGLIDNWRPIDGIASQMVSVKKKDKIIVPAYSGDLDSLFIFTNDSKTGKEPR